MLTKIEEYVVTHGDTTHTFSGLHGDTDKLYYIVGWLIASAQANALLAPNGTTTNQGFHQIWGNSWSGLSNLTQGANGLKIADCGANSQLGKALFWGTLSAKSGVFRLYHGNCSVYTVTGGNKEVLYLDSVWAETVTEITSLVLNLVSGHLDGGRVRLYKYT